WVPASAGTNGTKSRFKLADLGDGRCVTPSRRYSSVDVERLGSGRLAGGVDRDLLDAGLGLAQELLAAALEAFAALIDCNRLLKRNFAFLKPLHDGFKLLDGAFEGQALDVVVIAFGHACFRLSAIRDRHCNQFDAKV